MENTDHHAPSKLSAVDILELSRILRVPKSTIYAWTHKKLIPFYKAGRHLRFDLEKVLAHLEIATQKPNKVAVKRSRPGSLKTESGKKRSHKHSKEDLWQK